MKESAWQVIIELKHSPQDSTLLRLLLGFEAPTEGYIYYDQYNLHDINKSTLRRHCVSVVMQNGRLIEGTLLDNVTQQRVADCLKQLHCTRIAISQRPDTLRHCDRIITIR